MILKPLTAMITGSNSLSTMPTLVLLFLSNVMFMVESLSLYNWSTANSTLPRGNSDMVIGAWDDAIFLVGRNPDENQLLKYDTLNNQFIDYGEYYIPENVSTQSQYQFHTSINNVIYIYDDAMLVTFDMATIAFTRQIHVLR